ncbi:MAG: type IV pilus assembly protein PilM [Kiritimatiellaeota bacterium]|nr:type IV pilus assembly protein PilM [Kiritimatiellota bacterium]
MFKSDRVLALDVGSGKMTLAEFRVKSGLAPRLMKIATAKSPEEAGDVASLAATLGAMIAGNGFTPGPVLIALPGQSVFPRFVKLPPVTPDKVASMVEYEAEQNVPFPLAEVVWDYQILEGATDLEINALLVAVKRDGVSVVTEAVELSGLVPEVVDAAPTALYNAVRYNYPDVEGCVMVLDIGAKATNLIFIEEGKCFTRSIPVAGNAITQEIAKAMNVPLEEAEHLKQDVGFVALGGVYAMTDDETADKISKIVRNVATRLHAEVNRSINFYKSTQEGSAPVRVLLTGGTSLLPHIDTFFREKMQVEVEYLNPFINVAVEPSAMRGDAADPMRLIRLGNVVGLALRHASRCPVEINLLPPEIVHQRTFMGRIPYFAATVAACFVALACWYLYAGKMATIEGAQEAMAKARQKDIKAEQTRLDAVLAEEKTYERKVETLRGMVEARTRYARVLEHLRDALLPGMWLVEIRPEPAKGTSEWNGYTLLRVKGVAYEDILRGKSGGDGAKAVDDFLDALCAEGEDGEGTSPFLPKDAKNPGAGSRIQASRPDDSRVLRTFEIELALKSPLGVFTEGE